MTDPLPKIPGNLLLDLPDASAGEIFTQIVQRPGCTVERIVSLGQITPADAPYRQDHDEWVLLLAGSAIVDVGGRETTLLPGNHLLIPGGEAHRVVHTDPHDPTVWLAVHITKADR